MTKKQKRMVEAVAKFTHYMDTYTNQYGYIDYSNETFINDILYGLGIALDSKYEYSDGFDKFKKFLLEFLTAENKT